MKQRVGWLLYAPAGPALAQERVETDRLVGAAADYGLSLRVLDPRRIEVVVRTASTALYLGRERLPLPDVAIPRMGADTCGRTLMVLEYLEQSGVPLVNSPSAIRDTADKFRTLLRLAAAGVPIPQTLLPASRGRLSQRGGLLSFPVLVKPVNGTHGDGICMVETQECLEDLRYWIDRPPRPMIQEFLSGSAGRATRLLVFGQDIIACYTKVSRGRFKANTSAGASIELFDGDAAVYSIARAVVRCLRMDFAGIDVLRDAGRFVVCDVNSAPSFTGAEKALGINIANEVMQRVVGSLRDDL